MSNCIIGHASADENSKASGGKAGDQNGREVCTRSWYSSPWDLVLRPKAEYADKMAKACEDACANPNIGYDQSQRNTLNAEAKKVGYDLSKITTPCECDCSSLMTVCAQAAGIDVPYVYNNAPYTGNMRQQFTETGCFWALTDSKYLTSFANLKRGDILVRTSGHTAMVLSVDIAQGSVTPSAESCVKTVQVAMPLLTKNCRGNCVRNLQYILNGAGYSCGEADGDFGSLTEGAVKEYQSKNGLTADGEVGAKTWAKLFSI